MKTVQLRHVHRQVVVDVDVAGPRQVGPLLQEVAFGVENLHTVVLAVGHEHPPVGVHPDPVGDVELAGSGLPRRAPRSPPTRRRG